MPYGSVSNSWLVNYDRLRSIAKPKEGETFIVAASDSNNTDRADYVCDGTADEVEINQALNALPSVGGSVQLLEGTYNISASISIPQSNVSFIGLGIGSKIQTSSNINMVTGANSLSGLLVKKLYLYGAGTGANNNGIYFVALSNSNIEECLVENVGNNGIHITTGAYNDIVLGNHCISNKSYGIYCQNLFRGVISNNTCINNNDGIELYISNENAVSSNTCYGDGAGLGIALRSSTYNMVAGNVCHNSADGIFLYAAASNTITGNSCYKNTRGIYILTNSNTVTGNSFIENTNEGILLSGGDYNVVTGNKCSTNKYHGIKVQNAERNSITGNVCEGNDSNETGNYDGIFINVTADKNIISSNMCTNNGRYGVNIANANDNNNIVAGNHLAGNTGGPINDSGTDSQVFNNYED